MLVFVNMITSSKKMSTSHNFALKLNLSHLEHSVIVEIGSSRTKDFKDSSTFFFEKLSNKYKTEFFTIDFSDEVIDSIPNTFSQIKIKESGENFLKYFPSYSKKKIGILYLDNFDIIYNEKHKKSLLNRVGDLYSKKNISLNNVNSAKIHLEQLKLSFKYLHPKAHVIIDDTSFRQNNWFGKGALCVPYLIDNGFQISLKDEDGIAFSKSN